MQLIKFIIRPYKFLRIIYKAFKPLADTPKIKRKDLDKLLVRYFPEICGLKDTKTLDLGSGPFPKNPFHAHHIYGLDFQANQDKNIFSADLVVEKIPFDDSYFDYMTAYDFLEHIPRIVYCPERRFAFVEIMNEIWRTLKVGGLFLSHTPVYPYSPLFRDPTHVNLISSDTFEVYFDNKQRVASMYGFNGAFEIVHQFIREPYLISILRKVPISN